MEINLIAHFHTFDVVGHKVRADGGHQHMDFVAFTEHLCLFFTFSDVGVVVFLDFENLDRIGRYQTRGNCFGIVRLAGGREVEQKFHFVAADVIHLGGLGEFRPCGQVAVFGDFVVGDDVFAVRFARRAAGYRKVANGIISRHTVNDFECFDIPFHDFGGNEKRGVAKTFSIKFGVQRAEAGFFHLAVQHRVVFQHGNAVEFAFVIFVGDGFCHFIKRKNRYHGGQFAGAAEILSRRIHVATMRRFWARYEVHDVLQFFWVEHNRLCFNGRSAGVRFFVIHIVGIADFGFFAFSCLHVLLTFLPIESHDEILVFLRSIHFEQGICLFGVVAREEKPIF